jgi:hypothetical protein
MKRYVSYTIVAALALTTGLVSCGTNSEGDQQRSFDIPVRMSNGCPDLAAFYNGLSRMPSDGWVRRYTVNMLADDHNTKVSNVIERGASPRANFLSILYYSNFEMTEQRTPEFQSEMDSIQQVGCSKVMIGSQEYQVREATANSIRIAAVAMIKDAPFEKDSITFYFKSPRSVDIVRRNLVQDPCPHYDTVFVTKTTRMTWGHTSDPAATAPQEVDAGFVRRAMRAVYKLPSSLSGIQTESTGMMSMAVSDMSELRNSAVRRDMQACPYRAKPSEGDDPEAPLDPELATPTPAPAETAPAT